jgi:hypothetical protein
MSYRVYSGPKGSGEISPLAKEQMLFKELATLDEALSWARHVKQTARVPLLIEGDETAPAWTATPSVMPWVWAARAGRRTAGRVIGLRRASAEGTLAGDPAPFRAGADGQMLPFDADDIPVHQRPLR